MKKVRNFTQIVRLEGFFGTTTAMEHRDLYLEKYILPAFLCECETWALKLREGHTLWLVYDKMSRKIFGANWEEVPGGWTKLHLENIHGFTPQKILFER
jgi:hypothetical protein